MTVYFRNRPVADFSTAELLAIQASALRVYKPLRLWQEVSDAIECELARRGELRRAARLAA